MGSTCQVEYKVLKILYKRYSTCQVVLEPARYKGEAMGEFMTIGALVINERCPYCGANVSNYSDLTVDGETVSQRVSCSECRKEWFEVYELKWIEPIPGNASLDVDGPSQVRGDE